MKKILILLNLATFITMVGCSKDIVSVEVTDNNTKVDVLNKESVDNLGDDLFSKKFELEGIIYSMPTTIKEMQKHGWHIQEDSLKALNCGEKFSRIILENSNKVIGISIEDKSIKDRYIENYIVNGILVQKSETIQAEIRMPGNVSIGSTKEEVESVFEKITKYDSINESNELINYAIGKDGYSVSVVVDKSTNNVFSICLSKF